MLCIYHSKDLDGICSGVIMKKKHPGARMLGYDYGEPFNIKSFVQDEIVIMADVSMPMETMLAIANKAGLFLWIDHHKSAIADYEKVRESFPKTFRAALDIKQSACELTWREMFFCAPPQGVELLGSYDIWRGAGSERWDDVVVPFQYAMKMGNYTVDTFPDIILGDSLKSFEFVINTASKGHLVFAYQKQQNSRTCAADSFEAGIAGHFAIFCNGLHSSLDFDGYYDPDKHDLMVGFRFCGKDKLWHVSLSTSRDDVDVSEIAGQFGGGGHQKAAGFKTHDFFPLINTL